MINGCLHEFRVVPVMRCRDEVAIDYQGLVLVFCTCVFEIYTNTLETGYLSPLQNAGGHENPGPMANGGNAFARLIHIAHKLEHGFIESHPVRSLKTARQKDEVKIIGLQITGGHSWAGRDSVFAENLRLVLDGDIQLMPGFQQAIVRIDVLLILEARSGNYN